MKKILGISLIAVLAVSPMMANAAVVPGDPVSNTLLEANSNVAANAAPKYNQIAENAVFDKNLATAGYVKGAYNAAIKGINAEHSRATGVESDLQEAIDLLNEDADTSGSVANTVKTTAENATYTIESDMHFTDGTEGSIRGTIKDLDARVHNLNTNSADRDLSNLNPAGTAVITNAVKAGSQGADFAATNQDNGLLKDVTTIGTALNTLDTAVMAETSRATEAEEGLAEDIATNTSNIGTLNGSVTTENSVSYKINQEAADAIFTAAGNSNISAGTLEQAINEVAADYQAADTAIQNQINELGTTYATKEQVDTAISGTTLAVAEAWGTETVGTYTIGSASADATAQPQHNGFGETPIPATSSEQTNG